VDGVLKEIELKQEALGLKGVSKQQRIKIEKNKFQDGFSVSVDKKTTSTTLFNKRSSSVFRMSFITQDKQKSGFTFFLQSPQDFYRQTLRTIKKMTYKIYETERDVFVYQIVFNREDVMSLKEWVYLRYPHDLNGSQFLWRIAAVNSQEKMILAKTQQGSVVIYRQQEDGVAHPMATITPPIYWTKDQQQRQAMFEVNKDVLVLIIEADKSEYPILVDPLITWDY
jgi:hypothetical protein